MELDRRWLVGLAAIRGNEDSHTAHLLRAYHIPGMIELDLSPGPGVGGTDRPDGRI